MTTSSEVLQLIERGEGPALAFLPARFRPQALGETLVALANGHGGQVLIGLRRLRHWQIEGLPAPEEAAEQVLEVARSCVPPLVLAPPEMVRVQGRTVLLVTVPAGLPYAYHWHGCYLHRVEGHNAVPSAAELRSLLLERSEQGFERVAPAGATMDDLDSSRLEAYAAAQGYGEDALELLRQRGAVVDTPAGPRPSVAGLLLFGKHPQTFLPQAQVILARYPGTSADQEALRQVADGPLPEQLRQAEAFIQSHMRRGRMYVETERVEVTEYPLEAVHEALVNALVHRDYSIRGDCIRASMFQDRIEVYSPGRLAGPVTVENLGRERFARNPAIAWALADMGLARRLGYGVGRMRALLAEAHLPPPTFQETRAGFLQVLHGPSGIPLAELPADPQALARLGLNERQVQALLFAGDKGRISSRELQDICPEVSAETLRRDLADLVERGILLKVGERRATYYILK